MTDPPANQKPSIFLRLLLPRIEDILFIAIMVTGLALGQRMLNVDGDLGRHITIGNYILEQGAIPTRDLFSHTRAGEALTPHEWLSQVIFAAIYRAFGLPGIVFFCAILLGLTSVLLYRLALRRSGAPLVSLGVCLLAAAASSLHWLPRPHLFTILLLVIWLGGLEDVWEGKREPLFWMPAVMLAWANLHGAFIAGIVTWLVYGVGAFWEHGVIHPGSRSTGLAFAKRWGIVGGLSFLVTLANPDGLRLWSTSLGYLQNNYLVTHTQEYFSPDFHQGSAWPFLIMLLASLVLLGFQKRQNLRTSDILLLAAWAGMALISQRNIPLFSLAAGPALAILLNAWLADWQFLRFYTGLEERLARMGRRLTGWFWSGAAILILGVASLATASSGSTGVQPGFDPAVFPVKAVDWLIENPQPGKMFNYFPWGGYLLYRLWPDQTVFIDGQTDFYGETLTREYEQIITLGDGWDELLRAYQVDWIIIPSEGELSKELSVNPDWQTPYHDQFTTIFTRQSKTTR